MVKFKNTAFKMKTPGSKKEPGVFKFLKEFDAKQRLT